MDEKTTNQSEPEIASCRKLVNQLKVDFSNMNLFIKNNPGSFNVPLFTDKFKNIIRDSELNIDYIKKYFEEIVWKYQKFNVK